MCIQFANDENQQEKKSEEKGEGDKPVGGDKDSRSSLADRKKGKDKKEKKIKSKEKKDEKSVIAAERSTPSPVPSLNSADKPNRSPSPFRKNAVTPSAGSKAGGSVPTGTMPHMGSAASLKIHINCQR